MHAIRVSSTLIMHTREKKVSRMDLVLKRRTSAEKPRENIMPCLALEKKDLRIIKLGHVFSAIWKALDFNL